MVATQQNKEHGNCTTIDVCFLFNNIVEISNYFNLSLILFVFELNRHPAFGVFLEYICEIFFQKFTYVMNLQYHGGLLHIHDNLIKGLFWGCFRIVLWISLSVRRPLAEKYFFRNLSVFFSCFKLWMSLAQGRRKIDK